MNLPNEHLGKNKKDCVERTKSFCARDVRSFNFEYEWSVDPFGPRVSLHRSFSFKVYRGPSEKKGVIKHGYKEEIQYFAPWGYYVTQPEDKKVKKYH